MTKRPPSNPEHWLRATAVIFCRGRESSKQPFKHQGIGIGSCPGTDEMLLIVDANGRVVEDLVDYKTLPSEGSFNWRISS